MITNDENKIIYNHKYYKITNSDISSIELEQIEQSNYMTIRSGLTISKCKNMF